MQLYFKILSLVSCILILTTCETTNPPPDDGNGNNNGDKKPKITLTVDDTSPTEAWLIVTTENISLPDTFLLQRNGVAVDWFEITTTPFTVYEDSLNPSQSYTYRAVINDTLESETEAETMDTTSHDFSWEVFEFGEHGNSILRDVAIIDENNIWAVGTIYLKDSTGQRDTHAYNVVHWDGSEWQFSRATNVGLNAIIAFSSNDIWAFSSAPYHYDGNSWTPFNITGLFDGYVYGVWGTSSNNLLIVGGNGSIAHYNGTGWSEIASPTDLTLTDVYGRTDDEVYVSGVRSSDISGILLKGNTSGFYTLKNSRIIDSSQLFNQLYGELASIWIDEKGTLYIGGNLLYWNRREKWNYVSSLPENILDGIPPTNYRGFISSIRGNTSNDYVIVGERNTIKHFNGVSWRQLGMEYDPNNPIDWYRVEQEGDLIVAVGVKNNYATIIKLKR